jgi:LysM repeat protein
VSLPALASPPEPLQLQVANMAQDLACLQQQQGRLGLALEQVAHHQAALAKQLDALKASLHTPAPEAHVTPEALQAQKKAILAAVAVQLEALGQQTQQALDQLSAQLQALHKAQGDKTPQPAKAAAAHKKQACSDKETAPSAEAYPKEGLAYTVKKGDTLAKIAHAHHAQVAHIQAANDIQDPTRLAVGKVIFIPVLPESKK